MKLTTIRNKMPFHVAEKPANETYLTLLNVYETSSKYYTYIKSHFKKKMKEKSCVKY